MYYKITTFGCKSNQYDSSAIAEQMNQAGYSPVKANTPPDIHIINSCTVTANSDKKVRSLISQSKRDNPGVKIILCGCMPKAFPDSAEELVNLGKVDIAVPGVYIPNTCNTPQPHHAAEQPLPAYSPQYERTRAFLKIQDGCDRSCAYCIIPKARGGSVSRSLPDIINEAAFLVQSGHKELVITGINLCAYSSGGHRLVDTIEAVCAVDGAVRIRLGSLEPDMLTSDDIARLSKLPKLCPHFHLSLQSGSDTMLCRMNRRYDTALYRNTVAEVRELFPNCAITTDIIVGFPGETETEFAETIAFAEEMAFAKIHVFPYSRREGTAAAAMPKQLSAKIKQERSAVLGKVAARLRDEFTAGLSGTVQEVLIEKCVDGVSHGHTRCYTEVSVAEVYSQGDIVSVTL